MKIYIAGRVTGDDRYRVKFRQAMQTAEARGHIPLTSAMLPSGLTESDYMRLSLVMIECADLVLFLPDFTRSQGAMVEWLWCQKTGKNWDLYTAWAGRVEEVAT